MARSVDIPTLPCFLEFPTIAGKDQPKLDAHAGNSLLAKNETTDMSDSCSRFLMVRLRGDMMRV